LNDRREIRAAIAEAEAAERAKAEIGKELARLQLEIDAATEAHAAKCAPIQKQLLDLTIGITERLQLREKIEKHNRELQERVDTLTAAIRTAEAEQAALQPRTAPLPALKRRLLETASDSLQAEVVVAERTLSLANARAKAAENKLRDFEQSQEIARARSEAKKSQTFMPLSARLAEKPEKELGIPRDEKSISMEHRVLRLEALTAAQLQYDAARELQRLKEAMMTE
jgi:hypothetical protein